MVPNPRSASKRKSTVCGINGPPSLSLAGSARHLPFISSTASHSCPSGLFPWGRFASLQNIIEAACGANTARAGEGGERRWRGLRVEGRSLESKTSQPDSLHLTQCNLVLCTHRKTGESPKNRTLLLTAVLADAVNLGLSKMAEARPGYNGARTRLASLDTHLRGNWIVPDALTDVFFRLV